MNTLNQNTIIRLPMRRPKLPQQDVDTSLAKLETELRTVEEAIAILKVRKKGVLLEYRRIFKNARMMLPLFIGLMCATSTTGREGGRLFRHHPGIPPTVLIAIVPRRSRRSKIARGISDPSPYRRAHQES